MKKQKHIIIFSHGFGVEKDDRGLFSDIANYFPESKSILFDYGIINKKKNIFTVRTLSEEKEILKKIILNTKKRYSNTTIDIICHSQGAIIVGMVQPKNIRKIIFLAPPFNSGFGKSLEIAKKRKGTLINLNGITKLVRRDGSITLVPSKFWKERNMIEPIPLYNELSLQAELIILNAKQDNILENKKVEGLNKNIKILKLNGDHQFSGKDRINLLKKLKEILI